MTDSIWMLFLILGVFAVMQLAAIARSLRDTAAMMRRLLAHQGVDWETVVEPSDKVKELAVDRKNYVAAIKAYREQSGLGLKEAKAVVDGLARSRHGVA
jgi:ribosomal protein L7/L12